MTTHLDRSAIVMEVLTERTRQIEQEGWSLDHDDGHRRDELALAAAVYASPYPLHVQLLVRRPCGCRSVEECLHTFGTFTWLDAWPFRKGPRRMDRRRDLIRAAALIVAEIERLDRKGHPGANMRAQQSTGPSAIGGRIDALSCTHGEMRPDATDEVQP